MFPAEKGQGEKSRAASKLRKTAKHHLLRSWWIGVRMSSSEVATLRKSRRVAQPLPIDRPYFTVESACETSWISGTTGMS